MRPLTGALALDPNDGLALSLTAEINEIGHGLSRSISLPATGLRRGKRQHDGSSRRTVEVVMRHAGRRPQSITYRQLICPSAYRIAAASARMSG